METQVPDTTALLPVPDHIGGDAAAMEARAISAWFGDRRCSTGCRC
jgi:hypothetical protein